MSPGWTIVVAILAAASLAGCSKGSKDAPKTAEQARVEREAFEKQREERAMQQPDQVFGKALNGQEAAAKRSADYRKKVDDDLARREGEAVKDVGQAK